MSDMNVSTATTTQKPILVQKFQPQAKDSLKFAEIEKSFNLTDIVPISDEIKDGDELPPEMSETDRKSVV